MEVKYPVKASVRTAVRNGFELFTIVFAIVLPLVVIALTTLKTNISIWEIATCGLIGTLIWWYFCWFAFWLLV